MDNIKDFNVAGITVATSMPISFHQYAHLNSQKWGEISTLGDKIYTMLNGHLSVHRILIACCERVKMGNGGVKLLEF